MKLRHLVTIFTLLFAHAVAAGEAPIARPETSMASSCVPEFKNADGTLVAEGFCQVTVTLHLSDKLISYDFFLIEQQMHVAELHELDVPSEAGTLEFTINVFWGIVDGRGEMGLGTFHLVARPEQGIGFVVPLSDVLPISFKDQVPSRLEGWLNIKQPIKMFQLTPSNAAERSR